MLNSFQLNGHALGVSSAGSKDKSACHETIASFTDSMTTGIKELQPNQDRPMYKRKGTKTNRSKFLVNSPCYLEEPFAG